MNPAKAYLNQISAIEGKIESLQRNIKDIREKLTLSGVRYDGDRVQVTAGDRMADMFARLDILERKQRAEIARLAVVRAQIIEQVWNLPLNTAGLLERRYLRKYTLEETADDMGYSYEHIRHLHGEALKQFYERYKKEVDKCLQSWR